MYRELKYWFNSTLANFDTSLLKNKDIFQIVFCE